MLFHGGALNSILILLLALSASVFAQPKPYRDGKGSAAWSMHEVKINSAIASGVIGEVLGAEPSPEIIKDTLGLGRITQYQQLFKKTSDGVVFSNEFDLFTTILKGQFHQGHFWEALWNVENKHTGKFYLPGFERDRNGCDILIHFRFSEYTSRGFKLGKTQRCVIGNTISKIEDDRVADWKDRGAKMGNKIWKDFPSFLTRGTPVLHITSNGDTILPKCQVLSGNNEIDIPNLNTLCSEFFNGAVKIPIHLKINL
jgi:hypothetical protein